MRELFRYVKAGRQRVYRLRGSDDAELELWVEAVQSKRPASARKLVAFAKADDVDAVLADVETQLRVGGWLKV